MAGAVRANARHPHPTPGICHKGRSMRVSLAPVPFAQAAAACMPSRFTASLFGLAAVLLVSMTPPALADSRPLRGDQMYTPPAPAPLTTTQFLEATSAELLLGQFDDAGYDLAAVRGG